MPRDLVSDLDARKTHDDHLKGAGRQGKDAVAIVKSLRADLAKVDALAEGVVTATLGKRKSTAKVGAPQLHEIIASLHKKGVDVLKAGPRDLSPAQKKKHHDGVNAITPLLKRSSDSATELGKRLLEIHNAFASISRLYS